MTVVTCVDARGGVGFNGRRLSRDSAIIADIKRLASGKRLAADAYSAKLFDFAVTEDFSCCDILFVERKDISGLVGDADSVIVYSFGREYPADTYIGFDPESSGFHAVSTDVFIGSSHDAITKRVFKR